MIEHSAIYEGWVRHRRFEPTRHLFRYKVFMVYLDLAEQQEVFEQTLLWSNKPWSPARFRREDFFGDPSLPLDEAVRQRVTEVTGSRPEGAIRVLANWRYWGYVINPIVCYYCFDKKDRLQAVLAEVTNTPWKERHAYVLACDSERRFQRVRFSKDLHVSPFNPMNVEYDWKNNIPGQAISIHMRNLTDGECNFDATLQLRRRPMSGAYLNRLLALHPCMCLKVAAGIYWNALRLWLKRTPIFNHPANNEVT